MQIYSSYFGLYRSTVPIVFYVISFYYASDSSLPPLIPAILLMHNIANALLPWPTDFKSLVDL